MWPDRGEALSRTILAEQAIEDLYAEALRRWSPELSAAVLPTMANSLTAAADDQQQGQSPPRTLPPDPAAVQNTTDGWSATTETVIVAGIALLWAATVIEAMHGLGIALPDLPEGGLSDPFDAAVLRIVNTDVTNMSAADVLDAYRRVDATPALRDARDDYIATVRASAATTPGSVQTRVEAAVSKAEALAVRDPGAPTPAELTVTGRTAAAAAIDPSGHDMREVARAAGLQAAAAQNHAVIAAAAQQNEEFGEELDKAWISTLDGKTRPTHWAADGQRTPLAATFTVGGEHLAYPGDPAGTPAEVKNCRCRVGVLGRDEKIPDEVDRHTERLDGRDSVAINRDGRTQAEEIQRRKDAGNVRARDDPEGVGTVASGGWTAPSEQEISMANEDDTYLTFTDALFAVTGVPTSDGRMLASDIDITFRDCPMPLQWCEESEGGHFGSVTVGVIESITLKDGDVLASGYMLNNDNALKAIDLVSHGVNNPSVDLGNVTMLATYEDGTVVTEDNYDANLPILATTTAAEVLATTIVAIPAFGQTRIALSDLRQSRDKSMVAALIASVDGPRVKTYDAALFANPNLLHPTRPTMDESTGRIFGHMAEWGSTIRGGKQAVPRNHNDYLNFHTGQVQLTDGKQLSVGALTVKGGHAPTTSSVTAATARAHYDNASTAWGLVRVGEDRHGIWFSGVPMPGVDADTFQLGMSLPISGDWRDCGAGVIDMIAAHVVVSPGFPIYSASTGPDGKPLALVASFAVRDTAEARGGFAVDRESLKTLLTEVIETVEERHAARAAALADQQRAAAAFSARHAAALSQAREAVGDPPAELTPTERVHQLLDAGAVEFADTKPGSAMPAAFKRYWLAGAGASQIRWGESGDFDRCCTAINAKISEKGKKPLPDHEIKGLCASLHREATGATPGHAPGEKKG